MISPQASIHTTHNTHNLICVPVSLWKGTTEVGVFLPHHSGRKRRPGRVSLVWMEGP